MTPGTTQDISSWLAQYLRRRHRIQWNGECKALADFGIDSLASADLLCALDEELGLNVPNDFLVMCVDTDQLLRAIEDLRRDDAGAANGEGGYREFVNPYIARKLEQLKMDRTFTRAEGCHLYDADGECYIDFMAQYGALPFGHHPAAIWHAIEGLRAGGEPIFAQPSIAQGAGRLARRLIELAPAGLQYVTFSNSGAEAVEAALKMARQATGRRGILSTRRGFHGKTFGALSATGNTDYQSPFGLPLADFDCIDYADAQALERQLTQHPDHYAGFIVEAIQGEGGVREAPAGYLRHAKELCQRHGVLFILDEVQTGLGRTGALFACEDEGVVPDIMTLAKALGGGVVPIGATLCAAHAYTERFALKHSSTFAGNALAAAAGLATLDLLSADGGALLRHVREEGAYLRERLELMRAKHPWLVEEIRGRGFMLGIRFTTARVHWPENFLGIAAEERSLAQLVASYLLNAERVRLAPTLNGGDVLRVQPPLNATHAQCVAVMDAMERAIDVVATRNTALFYRAIMDRRAPPPALHPVRTEPAPAPRAAENAQESRFAFLLHPLDEQGYADYDPSLRELSEVALRDFADSMEGLVDPVVGSTMSITSRAGATARGDFIIISHTADQLKRLSQREALEVLSKGLDLAQERGARIVGLGAYTSVVSGGGSLLRRPGLPLTSGNSYTVVSGIQAINRAMQESGRRLRQCTVAVVGAAGSIGSCMATLLAERARRLILIGNPNHDPRIGQERLLRVAQTVIEHLPLHADGTEVMPELHRRVRTLARDGLDASAIAVALAADGSLVLTSSIEAVALADVVVSATSFPGRIIEHDMLARDAIVCDISRPRSMDAGIRALRPDVMVIDGGIIALPGRPRVGPYGLDPGTSYACMAETMLLALEGDFRDTSLGSSVDVREVRRQQGLARKHGFQLAGLQSFGRPIAGLPDTFSEIPVLSHSA